MQLEFGAKLSLVTSDDRARSVHHGWVAKDARREGQLMLCATDAYTFVRVPIGAPPEDFPHAEGAVPHEALRYHDENPDLPIKLAERHVMVGPDVSFRRIQGLTFPNLEQMLPPEPENKLRVAVNAEYLRRVAEALGNEQIELILDRNRAQGELYNTAIYVRAYDGGTGDDPDAADGLIMPVRVTEPNPPPPEPEPAE